MRDNDGTHLGVWSKADSLFALVV